MPVSAIQVIEVPANLLFLVDLAYFELSLYLILALEELVKGVTSATAVVIKALLACNFIVTDENVIALNTGSFVGLVS